MIKIVLQNGVLYCKKADIHHIMYIEEKDTLRFFMFLTNNGVTEKWEITRMTYERLTRIL